MINGQICSFSPKIRCYFLLPTFVNTNKSCTNAYFDLCKWLHSSSQWVLSQRLGRTPLRRMWSEAAAACSSGTLCTHIKTSLPDCVCGSACKTGICRHLWNSLCRHVNTLLWICLDLVTHGEDINIFPAPLYESFFFATVTEQKLNTTCIDWLCFNCSSTFILNKKLAESQPLLLWVPTSKVKMKGFILQEKVWIYLVDN